MVHLSCGQAVPLTHHCGVPIKQADSSQTFECFTFHMSNNVALNKSVLQSSLPSMGGGGGGLEHDFGLLHLESAVLGML